MAPTLSRPVSLVQALARPEWPRRDRRHRCHQQLRRVGRNEVAPVDLLRCSSTIPETGSSALPSPRPHRPSRHRQISLADGSAGELPRTSPTPARSGHPDEMRAGKDAKSALDAVVAAADPTAIDFRQRLVIDAAGTTARTPAHRHSASSAPAPRPTPWPERNMLADLTVLDAFCRDRAVCHRSSRRPTICSLRSSDGRRRRSRTRPLRRPVRGQRLRLEGHRPARRLGRRGSDRTTRPPSRHLDAAARRLHHSRPRSGRSPSHRSPETTDERRGNRSQRSTPPRITEVASRLIELSNFLHDEPELGWQEFRSSAAVAEVLAEHDFTVERPYLGPETAFRATYGTG